MDVCAMYLNMHARTPVQGSMLPFLPEHPNAASELDVPHEENRQRKPPLDSYELKNEHTFLFYSRTDQLYMYSEA
jgi:hypothetical protein